MELLQRRQFEDLNSKIINPKEPEIIALHEQMENIPSNPEQHVADILNHTDDDELKSIVASLPALHKNDTTDLITWRRLANKLQSEMSAKNTLLNEAIAAKIKLKETVEDLKEAKDALRSDVRDAYAETKLAEEKVTYLFKLKFTFVCSFNLILQGLILISYDTNICNNLYIAGYPVNLMIKHVLDFPVEWRDFST